MCDCKPHHCALEPRDISHAMPELKRNGPISPLGVAIAYFVCFLSSLEKRQWSSRLNFAFPALFASSELASARSIITNIQSPSFRPSLHQFSSHPSNHAPHSSSSHNSQCATPLHPIQSS